MATTTTTIPPRVASLCRAAGVPPRDLAQFLDDPKKIDQLLDDAIDAELAGDPFPVCAIARTSAERELRILARRGVEAMRRANLDIEAAERRRDEIAALLKLPRPRK